MKSSEKSFLIQKTGVITLCRATGVATGLLLDALILAVFGLGRDTDAFFAALTIPFLIDGVLSVQFTQVLVPILTAIKKESGLPSVWAFLSNVMTIWVLVSSCVALAGVALSAYMVPAQVPGLSGGPLRLAIGMNTVLVWLIPLSGLAAMLQGALYSFHQYWLPSSTKAINNLCIIVAVLFCYRAVGIFSLAIGYLAGFATQCVMLWMTLGRRGFVYRWNCRVGDPRLKDTAKLVFYPLAGQMLGECRTLFENFFASFYAPGILSALRYASRIIHALSGVLMSSVVTATAPMVAHYVAERDYEGMKRAVRKGMEILVFISLPVCAWLALTGESLISLLFQRGQFSQADAALTSSLLVLMTPYILFSRAITVLQTPFYAVKDTRTLLFSTTASFILYAIIIGPLVHFFDYYGFPLATSLATGLGTLVMCVLIHRSFGSLGWSELASFGVRMACVAGAMVGALSLTGPIKLWADPAGFFGKVLALGVPTMIALVAFCAAAVFVRVVEPAVVFDQLRLLRQKVLIWTAGAAVPPPGD